VEAMINSVDAKGFLCLQETLNPSTQGRLAAGPFAKQLGTLDRLGDTGRVRVLLEIMGGTIPVTRNANS
jgi:transcriptional antiterminator RfaH